jgi:2-polyprenyl-6-methoxyphenol hydroxylase-like FAD-dependent oxidoreductase
VPDVNKVLIVGAGVGGLGAGAALGQRGIEADIVEVRPEPKVFGVGINQPANSLRALRSLGVLEEILAAGYEFDRWTFHDQDGNVVVDVPSGLGGEGIPPQCALPRRDLHRILIGAAEKAGADIEYGTTVSELTDANGAVQVELSDGSQREYDLVLGYDGIKSPMRRRVFGDDYEPVYTGYAVWRVTVPRPPEITYAGLYQSPFHKGGFIPLTQETMYVLLVSPEPADVHYEQSDFVELLRERLEEFGGLLGDVRENLTDSDDVVYSPLSEVLLPAPWHKGRTVVLGDAAHACTPHITQGAAMALEDGVILAEELNEDRPLTDTLEAFSARRYPRAKFVQQVSRGILESEMQIDEQSLKGALEHMAAALPDQFAQVDEFLNQPA